MKVRSVRETAERYVRNSTMAFLEGKKDIDWVRGVLQHSGLPKETIWGLLLPLRGYGDADRGNLLFNWLATAGW
jgi:hypothetical protein